MEPKNMFSRKSRSTTDAPQICLSDITQNDLCTKQKIETPCHRSKRKFRRKTGVTQMEAPNLEQLDRSQPRFNWSLQKSVLATTVKKQASSVLYQFTRRKRSQVENPVIDITTCGSPTHDPAQYMSKSMDEVTLDPACRALSINVVYGRRSIDENAPYDFADSPSIDSSSELCIPHSEVDYRSILAAKGRYSTVETQHKSGLLLEPTGMQTATTPRSKRYSCSHVKFRNVSNTDAPKEGVSLLFSKYCSSPMSSGRNAPLQSNINSRYNNESMKEVSGLADLGVSKNTSGSSTPPRNVPPSTYLFRSHDDKNRDSLDSSGPSCEPRSSVTVHSRFKQFWVESFVGGRSRTKSENQTTMGPNHRGNGTRIRSPAAELDSENMARKDILPTHAHTITGGSNQGASLLRRLAQYTSLSTPPSDQMSNKSGTDSLKRTTPGRRGLLGYTSGTSTGRSGSVPIPPAHSIFVQGQNEKHGRHKSPRAMFGRLMSGTTSWGKSSEDMSLDLPDPSKLPREAPCSSLEFTHARLKNPKKISQKFQIRSGFDVHRRKRAGSLSGGGNDRRSLTGTTSPHVRPFLLENLSKSEETLISGSPAAAILFSSNTSGRLSGPIGTEVPRSTFHMVPQSQTSHHNQHHHHHHHHHHYHHHHHRHGNHGHHRNRGHFTEHDHHGIRATHTMTRVTESRRYLMFTRSLPFWPAKQHLETQGTGIGESETYSILFHHTECYKLMPDSAKLVILDSQLTISKAFRALIYNGIRAAPVWNSATQSITTMLTVTDFVQMLNLCWHETETDKLGRRHLLQLSDFDRLTIQKWKELLNINPLNKSKFSFSVVEDNRKCGHESKRIDTSGRPSLDIDQSELPCTTISCPTSNLSSPSHSRSSSSTSRSSTTSLPPGLLATQKLRRNNSFGEAEGISNRGADVELQLESSTAERNTKDGESESVKTPVRRASLDAVISSSVFSHMKSLNRLIFVHPEDSLYKALRLLTRFRLHHLPVIDSPYEGKGNVLYVLTQRRLLSYLFNQMPQIPQPRFMQSSLVDLNVGTFNNISLITLSTKLSDALLLFKSDRISALPVVDSMETRRLINLFSKYDVITLVLSGAYNNPDLTVQQWLEECKGKSPSVEEQRIRPTVETCLATNSLLCVTEKLVRTGFRRLVIVNNTTDYRVEGIVSLSDVLRFAVIQQTRPGPSYHGQPPPPSVAGELDEVVEEPSEVGDELENQTVKPRQRTIKFELTPSKASSNSHRTMNAGSVTDSRPTRRRVPILKDTSNESGKVDVPLNEPVLEVTAVPNS